MNRRLRDKLAEVERAGGRWRTTANGHVAVFGRDGRFVIKIRSTTNGNDDNGTDRAVWVRVLRRVRGEQP